MKIRSLSFQVIMARPLMVESIRPGSGVEVLSVRNMDGESAFCVKEESVYR